MEDVSTKESASRREKREPWRDAYAWIVETIDTGAQYQTRRLWELCGLPWESGSRKVDDRNRRAFIGFMEAIREELATVHKRVLRSPQSAGYYEIVPPEDHVTVVAKDFKRDVKRAVNRGIADLGALDTARVSSEEILRRDRAIAQMEGIQAMAKRDADKEAARRKLREATKKSQRDKR